MSPTGTSLRELLTSCVISMVTVPDAEMRGSNQKRDARFPVLHVRRGAAADGRHIASSRIRVFDADIKARHCAVQGKDGWGLQNLYVCIIFQSLNLHNDLP